MSHPAKHPSPKLPIEQVVEDLGRYIDDLGERVEAGDEDPDVLREEIATLARMNSELRLALNGEPPVRADVRRAPRRRPRHPS